MIETRLEGATLQKANRLLDDIVDYLNRLGIDYHLEGGTLLGFVRDGKFLEWDYDIDISIPQGFTERFYNGRRRLWLKGYRVTKRPSFFDYGPIKKGDLRILKVKSISQSFFSLFSKGARANQLVADVFIKFDNETDTYWIAKKRVMRVPKYHYAGFDEISYNGRRYRAPLKHRDYLTLKYGDWSVPVKEWNCATDEKSVVGILS